jgi:hydroxymethylpyrimidine pyrophosphatase-like HAD family hydrolase
VPDFGDKLDQVAKIVGVSDDYDKVRRCEADAQTAFEQHATAARSQPYYLDITNKEANKGAVVEYLSSHLNVPAGEIATIGDQTASRDRDGLVMERIVEVRQYTIRL